MARFGVSPWATENLRPTSQYESILDPRYKRSVIEREFPERERRLPRGAGKMGNYLAEQRKLQNKIAEEQLRMMKQQRKQGSAREFERKDAAAKARYQAQFDPQQRMAQEALNKMREEASNRAAVIAGTGPNALGMPGARKARRVSARGMFTGGDTGRASISPYGDPGISATPRNEGAELIQAQVDRSPYSYAEGLPAKEFGGLPSSWGARPWPSREKGGTVPKTGPYELHKGEIVVSADQVDDPLLHALKTDKLEKMGSGQMDGKGTGPGRSLEAGSYRGGTMRGYQGGSIPTPIQMPIPPGMSPTSPNASLLSDLNLELESRGQPPLPLDASEEEMMVAAESLRGGYSAPPSLGQLFGEPTQAPPSVEEFVAPQENIPETALPAGTLNQGFQGITRASGEQMPVETVGDEEFERRKAADRKIRDESEREHDKFMAVMNNTKADRLASYLARNAGDMDQQSFIGMNQQIGRLRKSSEIIDKRMEGERTRREEAEESATQHQRVFDMAIKRAEATQEFSLEAAEAVAAQERLMSAQEALTSAETPQEMQTAVNVLAGLLFDLETANRTPITWGQATAMAQGLRGMASEQFSTKINAALKKAKAAGAK